MKTLVSGVKGTVIPEETRMEGHSQSSCKRLMFYSKEIQLSPVDNRKLFKILQAGKEYDSVQQKFMRCLLCAGYKQGYKVELNIVSAL